MPEPSPATTLVFYDGVCGLCNRLVQFLLRRDRRAVLRFATLQGALAARELGGRGYDLRDLDTVFVIGGWKSDHPRVFSRSRAVLHALAQLGPGWRAVAMGARIVPRPLADALYGTIARRRYRMFGRYETCPLPSAKWRERFVEDAEAPRLRSGP